jgi:hypothetical protein
MRDRSSADDFVVWTDNDMLLKKIKKDTFPRYMCIRAHATTASPRQTPTSKLESSK